MASARQEFPSYPCGVTSTPQSRDREEALRNQGIQQLENAGVPEMFKEEFRKRSLGETTTTTWLAYQGGIHLVCMGVAWLREEKEGGFEPTRTYGHVAVAVDPSAGDFYLGQEGERGTKYVPIAAGQEQDSELLRQDVKRAFDNSIKVIPVYTCAG